MISDLSIPNDTKPGDQGKKNGRFGENPGDLSTVMQFIKINFSFLFIIVFRHFDKVDRTYLDATNW